MTFIKRVSSYICQLTSTFVYFQADVVFEEQDKGFWFGLNELRRQAKRPIIITANGKSLLRIECNFVYFEGGRMYHAMVLNIMT